MNDFLKKLMKLATELNNTDSAITICMIINDMEILYKGHVDELLAEQSRPDHPANYAIDEIMGNPQPEPRFNYDPSILPTVKGFHKDYLKEE